jgi:pimeloyl-ACP methyl ester carboxylesterase
VLLCAFVSFVASAANPCAKDYEKFVRSLSSKTDYRLINGTGHFVMLEKPSEFNAVLTEMLAKFGLVGK